MDIGGLNRLRWPLGVGMAAAGGWIYSRIGFSRSDRTILWVLGALHLLMLASCLWSLLPTYTFLRAGAQGLVFAFAGIGAFAFASRNSGRVQLFWILIASSLALSPLVFSGLTGASAVLQEGSRYRYTAVEALRATGTAEVALNIGIALVYFHCVGPYTYRKPALLMFLLAVAVVLLSRTRGVLAIGLVVIPVLWRLLKSGKDIGAAVAMYLLLAFIGSVGWSALSDNQKTEFRSFFRISDVQETLRTRVDGRWEIAIPKALERPLLGRGFGLSRYYPEHDAIITRAGYERVKQFRWAYTHNQFLSVFYDFGLLGLILFVVPIAMTAREVFYLFQSSRMSFSEWAMTMTMSAYWGQNVLGMMFHDGRLTIGNASSYWYLIQTVWIWQMATAVRSRRQSSLFPKSEPFRVAI